MLTQKYDEANNRAMDVPTSGVIAEMRSEFTPAYWIYLRNDDPGLPNYDLLKDPKYGVSLTDQEIEAFKNINVDDIPDANKTEYYRALNLMRIITGTDESATDNKKLANGMLIEAKIYHLLEIIKNK